VIRVYGAELQPYILPKFLTLRIFSLELIRQRLNYDHVNFLSNKKKTSFNLKKEVGPFIVKDRSALQEAEERLKEMGFELANTWNYYPHGVITTTRKKYGLPPYSHQLKPKREKVENLGSWEDVQRILQDQQQ